MEEVVYFELNNWMAGRDYPEVDPFVSWMQNDLKIKFRNEEWVKENKLCVVFTNVDMSQNFCITATKEWVEKNCPALLQEYSKFVFTPDKYGDVEGRFGGRFLEYSEENIGIIYDVED